MFWNLTTTLYKHPPLPSWTGRESSHQVCEQCSQMTWRPGGDLKDGWGGEEFERRWAGAGFVSSFPGYMLHSQREATTSKSHGVCACMNLQHCQVPTKVLLHTTARQTARPGKSKYPELCNSNAQSLPLRTWWRMWVLGNVTHHTTLVGHVPFFKLPFKLIQVHFRHG